MYVLLTLVKLHSYSIGMSVCCSAYENGGVWSMTCVQRFCKMVKRSRNPLPVVHNAKSYYYHVHIGIYL